jgi:hypothetical protein
MTGAETIRRTSRSPATGRDRTRSGGLRNTGKRIYEQIVMSMGPVTFTTELAALEHVLVNAGASRAK